MKKILLKILESPDELSKVEEVQRQVWPGSSVDIVPVHMLLAAVHNGGLVIGAFEAEVNSADRLSETEIMGDSTLQNQILPDTELVAFVFGFPGISHTADGLIIKHHSHMMGVLPGYRDRGIGFLLKRAQWQMVRHQSLDQITWTYDPLLSRNAYLNISRLGAVCNTYIQDFYGEMRDGVNAGTPSDRFQVDWWVNSGRVTRRLSKKPRLKLDLAHFLAADTRIINPTQVDRQNLPRPIHTENIQTILEEIDPDEQPLILVEIPADYLLLKEFDLELANIWRAHSRIIFIGLFNLGYLITDFVHLAGTNPRSFYVLSHGESTL